MRGHWTSLASAFGPSRGSAAFTATPCRTPDNEKSAPLEIPRSQNVAAQNGCAKIDRGRSVDSNKTLVDDGELVCPAQATSGNFKTSTAPTPPLIDGSSQGIVLVAPANADDETAHGVQAQWVMTDRELYHRLQNLSSYPGALAIARRRILKETSHLLEQAEELSRDPLHIFSLPERFDAEGFRDFLQRQHDATTAKYTDYSQRRHRAYQDARAAGVRHREAKLAGMEMFAGGRERAKQWLRRASVVKYVDGAWLQHLYKATTGLAPTTSLPQYDPDWIREQRQAARASWQVMTEELGDGDLTRSHVAIYEALMDSLAAEDGESAPTPKGEDRRFTEWVATGGPKSTSDTQRLQIGNQDSSGNDRCWRSAVSQLAMSVCPNDFLPECLGWNCSYEGLPYHLLVSSRELQEHSLDAYYFWLHVSIDNASSGHSAMARECVVRFLEAAAVAGGQDLADEVWARIKLGFALADFIPTTPVSANVAQDPASDDTPIELTYTAVTKGDAVASDREDSEPRAQSTSHTRDDMARILAAKARTAHGLHGGVQAKLAGQSLSYWLDPAFAVERAPRLLDALADSPAWIRKGDPASSKFVQEFEWGGKMFGALSSSEAETLRAWVRSLANEAASIAEPLDEQGVSPVLPSDAEAEMQDRRVFEKWLSSQGRKDTDVETARPSLRGALSSAEKLRPFELPGILRTKQFEMASWHAFETSAAQAVLRSILERLDAVRPLPYHTPQLLTALDATVNSGLKQAKIRQDVSITEQLRRGCAPPPVTTEHGVRNILPSLWVLTSLFEHSISDSPGRLASPLGMAAVKVLRILHGFSEYSEPHTQSAQGGDGSATGCMGTEDSLDTNAQSWLDIVEDAWRCTTVSESQHRQAPLLHSLVDGPARRAGLPALALLLSSHFWKAAPVLLGMSLAIVDVARQGIIQDRLSATSLAARAFDIDRRLSATIAWLERAVSIGIEADAEGKSPRGVTLLDPASDWHSQVRLGWGVAVGGLVTASR
ncbi:unnamed protein product [Parajaminaea phylloscopi]